MSCWKKNSQKDLKETIYLFFWFCSSFENGLFVFFLVPPLILKETRFVFVTSSFDGGVGRLCGENRWAKWKCRGSVSELLDLDTFEASRLVVLSVCFRWVGKNM